MYWGVITLALSCFLGIKPSFIICATIFYLWLMMIMDGVVVFIDYAVVEDLDIG